MAIAPAETQTSYDEWRTRRWRLVSSAIGLLWLITAVAAMLAGEKQSDIDALESALANGSVSSVEIVGGADWSGRTQVTLRWRESLLSRYAEVPLEPQRDPAVQGGPISGNPTTYLRGVDPDVQISYSEPTGFQEWRGWRAPGWVALMAFAAWLGTALLLIGGPEPWRATRWAWGWFVLMAGPLGSLGFLLLGGPLSLARPKDVRHRLTGGWAFLIALVFFGGANAG